MIKEVFAEHCAQFLTVQPLLTSNAKVLELNNVSGPVLCWLTILSWSNWSSCTEVVIFMANCQDSM